MSRIEDLERDRQIADIQAIFTQSLRGGDHAQDGVGLDEGEVSSRELGGFGDGFEPPRGAWRARLARAHRPAAVFLLVAVLTAVATASVTWFLRPAATPVPGASTAFSGVDERDEGSHRSAALTPEPNTQAAPTSPATVVVAVVGQVAHPGLVTLTDGARVSDAISAAGGALPGTDLTTINIARRVADGEQISVGIPAAADAPAPQGQASKPGGADAPKVNVNTAGVVDLDALPGIGPVLAQRIVDFRTENGPFASVGELTNVSGVGPSVLAKIQPQVTV